MSPSTATGAAETQRRTPVGVLLCSLLLGLFGVAWIGFGFLIGGGGLVLISWLVGGSVLLIAYFLSRGSLLAWWLAIAVIGGSTLWRLGLVVDGRPNAVVSAVVSLVLVGYLLSQYDFYREPPSERQTSDLNRRSR